MGFKEIIKSAGQTISKNSPTILTVAGVIGFGVTIILASKATLDAQNVLAEHKKTRDKFIEDNAEEIVAGSKEYTVELGQIYGKTIRSMAKLYLPAIAVGIASTAAILGGHHILSERNVKLTNTLAATTAAYNKLDDFVKQYRKRVIDDQGEDKDKQYAYGFSRDKVDSVDEDGKKVKLGGKDGNLHTTENVGDKDLDSLEKSNPYVAIFKKRETDASGNVSGTVEFKESPALNMVFLKSQQNYWNDILHSRTVSGNGVVMLNEVRQSLGLEPTSEGAILGWSARRDDSDNYISFGITDFKYPQNDLFLNGYKSACILEFNCDGVVYEDINTKMPHKTILEK